MSKLLLLAAGTAALIACVPIEHGAAADGSASGRGTIKIVGGEPATPAGYPFQVALIKTDAYGEGPYPEDEPLRALGCAGTLLSPSWVLTAAHCVAYRSFDFSNPGEFPPVGCLPFEALDLCTYRKEALVVLAGTQELLPHQGKRHQVKRIIVNDGYSETYQEHDIALVELEKPVASAGAMLVADPDFTSNAQQLGTDARAVGWGLIDEMYGPSSVVLRQIDIPVQPLDRCRERHKLYEAWVRGKIWSDIEPEKLVTENMICVGWDGPPPQAGGRFTGSVLPNVCYGDSGGFVGLEDAAGRWVQIGIPSWFRDCKSPYIYSVLVNVAAYRGWIENATGLTLSKPST